MTDIEKAIDKLQDCDKLLRSIAGGSHDWTSGQPCMLCDLMRLQNEVLALLKGSLPADEQTTFPKTMGDVPTREEGKPEHRMDTAQAQVDVEDALISVLNQARCLEKRTVGNKELARRISERFHLTPKTEE